MGRPGDDLEVRSLRRLRELLIRGSGHEAADLNEDGLHGKVTLPRRQIGEVEEIDLRYRVKIGFDLYTWPRLQLTLPFRGSTHGRLTLLMNVNSGGTSG